MDGESGRDEAGFTGTPFFLFKTGTLILYPDGFNNFLNRGIRWTSVWWEVSANEPPGSGPLVD